MFYLLDDIYYELCSLWYVVEVPQWLTADDFISCKLMLKIDPIHATSTCFFFLYKCLSAVMNYLRRLDLSHVRSGNWRTFHISEFPQ